uniref:Outer membrane protein assembly factor BamA n=1 Tax=Desulfobacca acetoxidans TaxID=60893 RepID=A0A7V6A4U1_9BACT
MRRRLLFALLLIIWVLVGTMGVRKVPAQEPELIIKKVALFPFPVLSKVPRDYLGEKVTEEFEKRFKAEGLTVVPLEDLKKEIAASKEPMTDKLAKEIGQRQGADTVVYGQVVIVGEAVALEAHVIDLSGRLAPVVLKLQGTGISSLPGLARQMAGEAALRTVGKERIKKIAVRGNHRIEADAIVGVMQTREGDLVNPTKLREDLKAIYKLGYFTDVRFDISETPQGRVLTIIVKEKPSIHDIIFRGNFNIKSKALKDAMEIKNLTVASEPIIKEAIEKGLKVYREKGYYGAKITYSLEPLTPEEVNLVFNVEEGGPVTIKEIRFEGNTAFTAKELKKVIETKEKGLPLISRITGAGKLVQERLEQDAEKIGAFYFNHGYIKAKVGEPKVDVEGGWAYITFPITEGPQFKVGKVDFQGDLLESKEDLFKKIHINKENIYSREVIQKDITTLSDLYADQGYANADVTPLLKENDKTRTVDITFDITKGKKVYFERIEIAGNVKTRDKVIRRELRVYEQELFNATKLKEGMKNLKRLEYFEDVNLSTSPGTTPDRINLKVTVKEKPTGSFGVGVGYSTQDHLVGMIEVSQNNLFGRGQRLQVQAMIGSIASRYRISFTEPYLFDRPLGLGIDVYNWMRIYDEYTQNSTGGSIRLAHPLRWKYTKLFGSYRWDYVKLYDLSFSALNTPTIVQASKIHNTSAMSIGVARDTRDSLFTPTHGMNSSATIEWAGLGGQVAFLRYIVDQAFYRPLKWNTVGVFHVRGGYLQALGYGQQPSYELFYLGGIDTIRGFRYATISPRDPVTHDRVGGNKFFQVNTEWRFPVPRLKNYGIVGLVFFDCGNVYGSSARLITPNVRTSLGGGIRWFSPMGPLRVEWGYNLDKKSYEQQSAWEFTIGGSF